MSEPTIEDQIASVVAMHAVYSATGGALGELVDSLTDKSAGGCYPALHVARAIARLDIPHAEASAALAMLISARRITPIAMKRALGQEDFPLFGFCVDVARSGQARSARRWAIAMGFPPSLVKGLRDDGTLVVGPGVDTIPPCAPRGLDVDGAPVSAISDIQTHRFRVAGCPNLRSIRNIHVEPDTPQGQAKCHLVDLPALQCAEGIDAPGTDVLVQNCGRLDGLALEAPLSLKITNAPLPKGVSISAPEGWVISDLAITKVKGPCRVPSATYGAVAFDACDGLVEFPDEAIVVTSLSILDCPHIHAVGGTCRGTLRIEGCNALVTVNTALQIVPLDHIPPSVAKRPELRPHDGAVSLRIGTCSSLVEVQSRLGGGLVPISLQIRACPSLAIISDWIKDLLLLGNPSYALI